jgi:uncharacterized protein involved in cysteine biosynthesis
MKPENDPLFWAAYVAWWLARLGILFLIAWFFRHLSATP